MFNLYGVVCASLFGVALYFIVINLVDWVAARLRKRKETRAAQGVCDVDSAGAKETSAQGAVPPKRLISAHAKRTNKKSVGVESISQAFPGTKGRKR